MRPIDDPSISTGDERLAEVACILATGVLKLRARATLHADGPRPQSPPDFEPPCLEVSHETVLSVHTG